VREGDGQEYQKHWINPRKIFFFLKGVVIHFGWHLSTLHKKFLKDKRTPISSRKKRKQPSIEELQSLLEKKGSNHQLKNSNLFSPSLQ
jgi:hypothetical protein